MFHCAQNPAKSFLFPATLVLVLAFLIILAIGLLLQQIVHGTLLRVAEQKAMSWAEEFVTQIPDLPRLASTGETSDAHLERIQAIVAGGDIFRFKLFSPSGELNFISDEAEFRAAGGDSHSAKAREVFEAMVGDVAVKNGEDNPDRPDTFVEAYIPAKLPTGEAFGVIEVYVDVSSLAAALTDTFRVFGTLLALGCAIIYLVPSFILVLLIGRAYIAKTRQTWLAAILYHAPFQVVIKDVDGFIRAISRNVAEEFNLDAADFIGKTTADFLPSDIAQVYMDADSEVVKTGNATQSEITENINGQTRNLLNSKFPLFDSNRRMTGICSITNDVTDMKNSQSRLAQSQKMEAVGQLTGGIAHDFNNLLAIILWCAEELKIKQTAADESVETIIQTVEKGAALTQQLLSYSRRQNLKPQVVNVSELIQGLIGMLERTLGETIEISTNLSSDLCSALIDPNQLENALLNLAINARDAMPKGGKLVVECKNASVEQPNLSDQVRRETDAFVVVSVKDNGIGMSQDTLRRVFEPFFTTKSVGKGSGLGLSMVYGFAEQSSGHVKIDSQLGDGTTINLYLPCANTTPDSIERVDERKKIQERKLSVLLVEDDFRVRNLAQKLLMDMGHSVTSFSSASKARNVFDGNNQFDVLLSDVVLPDGLSGPEFSEELDEYFPNAKVIFMSGYPQSSLDSYDFPNKDWKLLNKPFDRNALANALF